VGAGVRGAAEHRDDVACHPAPGLDAKKKTVVASERDEQIRAAWRLIHQTQDARQFVFVDEIGTHLALSLRFAWAPRGQRAHGQVPRNWGKNTTLVAGLSLDGLQAPWTIEGAMDTDAFAVYVEQVLCPSLRAGQTVVMDTLSVHTAARIRQVIEASGGQLLFLPPYSPDLNPIEEAFAKLKAWLRRVGARSREALLDAIDAAIATITLDDVLGWFTHAGYRTLPQAS
jgi:transposase